MGGEERQHQTASPQTSKVVIAFDEHHAGSRAPGGNGCGDPCGTTADDNHVRRGDNGKLTTWLQYFPRRNGSLGVSGSSQQMRRPKVSTGREGEMREEISARNWIHFGDGKNLTETFSRGVTGGLREGHALKRNPHLSIKLRNRSWLRLARFSGMGPRAERPSLISSGSALRLRLHPRENPAFLAQARGGIGTGCWCVGIGA